MTGAMVNAGPARNHVRRLVDDGMTQQAICRTANVTLAALSALLHGQYVPGRPPQKTIYSATADRLLAVKFQAPTRKEASCAPGDRYEPVGYRTGRCTECGQVAPVHTRDGVLQMMAHPRAASDAPEPAALPAPVHRSHSDCGTTRGHSRHRREKTDPCEPCKAARRGYDQGMEAAITRARREAASDVPAALAEQIVAFCRAYVLQPWPPGRPVPRSRALAKLVVQAADAELVAEEDGRAA